MCHQADLLAQVLAGELLVVVGQVGAGKSSLLSAMLGEMRLQQVLMGLLSSDNIPKTAHTLFTRLTTQFLPAFRLESTWCG